MDNNKLIVKGLNVRETETGDSDKIITLCTMECGKISVIAKGVKSIKSKNLSSTQLFSYSNYVLKKTNNFYYIQETELIEGFFNLSSDLNKMSLASYFCEVCSDVIMENQPEPEILQLTLNSLYALNSLEHNFKKIKAVFEFRMASICGFCPDLSCCASCNSTNDNNMYLDVMNGRLLCKECKPRVEKEEELLDNGTTRLYFSLTSGSLNAMRYTVNASSKRLFSFEIDDDDLYLFGKYSEGYLINQLEHNFYTLDFYKSII